MASPETAMILEGRHVGIAFLQSPKVTLNLFPMMLKRLTLTGSTLRAGPVADKAAIAAQLRKKVWPLLAQGSIRPLASAHSRLPKSLRAMS